MPPGLHKYPRSHQSAAGWTWGSVQQCQRPRCGDKEEGRIRCMFLLLLLFSVLSQCLILCLSTKASLSHWMLKVLKQQWDQCREHHGSMCAAKARLTPSTVQNTSAKSTASAEVMRYLHKNTPCQHFRIYSIFYLSSLLQREW